MPNETLTPQSERGSRASGRLHYLDWLQVLAVLGIFLFHAVHPFDDLIPWHIKNAKPSVVVSIYVGFLTIWGMPFFFLMAGATSWFSLQRRTPARYFRERIMRLLIPFIIGSIILTPIQAYFEYAHKGWWPEGSILRFILSAEARTYFYTEHHPLILNPGILGVGYHLWFVGGLFVFACLALPLFAWLNRDTGRRFLAWFANLTKWRGGLLVFVIPMVVERFLLQPGSPAWADFFFYLLFFICGYIVIADKRFTQAIRRDRLLYLILGIACTLFFTLELVGVPVFDWLGSPGAPEFYLAWAVFGIDGWCWTMVMFYVGMQFLDFSNKWLQYGREASYPFYILHQPVIIFIAFYAVDWEVPLLIKLLVVLIGSFALTIGIYELLVRRLDRVRALFGMKPRRR